MNTIVTPALQTSSLVIGVYTTNGTAYADTSDPGFSFYNRGSVTASPANIDNNALGMLITGPSAHPTILTGGIFNSGLLAITATTTGTTASSVTATALSIQGYTSLDNATYDATALTPKWIDAGTSLVGKNGNDQGTLVNSSAAGTGTISATVSGTRGGVATAITIASTSNVPSIVNSGTISASATTTDETIVNPLEAFAIVDLSGSVTSIYNTGSITAAAGVGTSSSTSLSALDNNTQVAQAINLATSGLSAAASNGVTITDQATSNGGGIIRGDILFGTGINQILTIAGDSASHPGSVVGNVSFGADGSAANSGDQLTIFAYGALSGAVTAANGVAVDIKNHGVLALQNASLTTGTATQTATTLNATNFTIESGGRLSLSVSEALTNTGVVAASTSATIESGANLGVAYASFVPQVASGGNDEFVLITAPHGSLIIDNATVNLYNTSLTTNTISGGSLPFLFKSAQLAQDTVGNLDQLVLRVVPKTSGLLGLTAGSAGAQLFDRANTALGKDDVLGSAMVNGIATTAQAQAAYNSFAPSVTGGSRAIAISITDQATGPVAARQRSLRLYGTEEGEETLWGQEFAQMIKDPGRGAIDPNTVSSAASGAVATGYRIQPGFKDHGFGFAIGMDGGSPKYGWYGGALTFYTGDVGELARNDHTNEQWYMLSGYSTWRGKGLFFDSKVDFGYGSFKGKRYISLSIPSSAGTYTYTREADNTHAGELLSAGFTTGGIFTYGATTLMPQISVDGLVMREEGYTEKNPGTATVGDGFDLQVQPYYAQSLRVFLGAAVRYDINLWDFYLQPEARAGYRYDIFNDPVKLKAAFAYASSTGTPGTSFTMVGPDPSQGNFVVGGSLASTTDTWTMGLNFDLVRGSSGGFQEVGTFNLVGRI